MNSTNSGGFRTFAVLILIIIIWLVAGSVRQYALRENIKPPTVAEWEQFVNYPYEDINDAVAPSISALANAIGYDSAYEFRLSLVPDCINGPSLMPCSTMD